MNLENTVVREYDYYTLDQAREIIYNEMRHARLVRNWKFNDMKKRRRQRRVYFLKQCIFGLTIIFLGCGVGILLLDGDCTFSVVTSIIGIGLIFTKRKVVYK